MRIQIVSDLHLEFSDCFEIKNENNTDVLILGGDIMIASKVHKPESEYGIRFRDFLKRMSFQFPHVVYVMGNHEFYDSGRFFDSVEQMRLACGVHDNVYLLERDTKIIDDVMFVGGTLWTDMNNEDPDTMHRIRFMMNDFNCVKNITGDGKTVFMPEDAVEDHNEFKRGLDAVLEQHPDLPVVVCGHHAPSRASTHPRYRNEIVMNGAYSTNLDDFILDRRQIKLWTHGHTHEDFDYMIGTTRVVCNPRGYDGYEARANQFQLKYVEV